MKIATKAHKILIPSLAILFSICGTACEKQQPVPTPPSSETSAPTEPIVQKPIAPPTSEPTPTIAPSPTPQTTLVVPSKDIINRKGPISQIKNLKFDNGDLCFTSTGTDPYFVLNKVDLKNRPALVRLEITVPSRCVSEIFYQTIDHPALDRSLIQSLKAGRNTIEWQIDGQLGGYFRLDPGNAPGAYRIHKLEFVF